MNRPPLSPVRLNPSLPPKLEDVINRALEKDRDLRYQHAVDIKSELMRLKRDLESGRTPTASSSSEPVYIASAVRAESQPTAAERTSVSVGAFAPGSSGSAGAVPAAARARTALWKFIVPAAVVLVLALIGGFYWRKHQTVQLTDKDQLILADFTNQTGDAVFDSTLKEALAIQLEQSPLLQLVSDAELHNNLQYLGQSREQKIAPELAQQLGQRLGVKAYLAGTIANLGSSYVISINAVNCATGEVFARQQETAPDKTAVLQAVSKAATAMRARLGESMASIQKLTTPYTNVTTASLQAFHAFSLGEDEHRMGRDFPQAASFYQQAIELDPNFAMAYARLGVAYSNQGAAAKGLLNLKKAYDLRERVTERERMYIESQYALQQFDLPKALESYKLYVATYPRDATALNNLAQTYVFVGEFEKALTGYEKTWEIAKWDNVAADNAAGTLLSLDRITEGERYLKEALEQGGVDDINYHGNLLLHDFQAGHSNWEKEMQWAAAQPAGFMVETLAGNIKFFSGRIHIAGQQWEHAARRAEQQHFPATPGRFYALKAVHDALASSCTTARDAAHRGLALDRSLATVPDAALALALCGETGPALQEMERLATGAPTNTLVNDVYLPEVKAAMALAQHHPEQVSGLLSSASAYSQV